MPTSHVDLFPEHVFLPGDPISEESGLREARTHLTLHAIMLRAHSMAKESWGDCKPSTGGGETARRPWNRACVHGTEQTVHGPAQGDLRRMRTADHGRPEVVDEQLPDEWRSYPLNEIHEKIARWGVKTHLQDDDEAVLPLLPSPEAFGEDMDPFDAALTRLAGTIERGWRPGDAGKSSLEGIQEPNPFERAPPMRTPLGMPLRPTPQLQRWLDISRVLSSPLYTSRRSWWKRVISCEALMHRRLRYNQL
ncbi:hypothetical protein BD626DRAFT_637054 [Schizophyllum amplum]|uniref:Uncharacterized protein n=1 Tax=Schizophyllum amplum TaxID=97359 RepID=A0A550BSR3_9AGAR|nr:hypothetical protein BD626DRAFT_637054 [Auriculariopsis ampla]